MLQTDRAEPRVESSTLDAPNNNPKNRPLHYHQMHHHAGNTPQSTASTRERRTRSADNAANLVVQELRFKGYDPETGGDLLQVESYQDGASTNDRYGPYHEDGSRYSALESSFDENGDVEIRDDPDSSTWYTRDSVGNSRFSSFSDTYYNQKNGMGYSYDTRDESEATDAGHRARRIPKQGRTGDAGGKLKDRIDHVHIPEPSSAHEPSLVASTTYSTSTSIPYYMESESLASGFSENTEEAYNRLVDDTIDPQLIRGKLDSRIKELERKKRKLEALARKHQMEEEAEAAAFRRRAQDTIASPRSRSTRISAVKSRSPPRRTREQPTKTSHQRDTYSTSRRTRSSSRSPSKSRRGQPLSPPKARGPLRTPSTDQIPPMTVPTKGKQQQNFDASVPSMPPKRDPRRLDTKLRKNEGENTKHLLFDVRPPPVNDAKSEAVPNSIVESFSSRHKTSHGEVSSADSLLQVHPMLEVGTEDPQHSSVEFGLSKDGDDSVSLPHSMGSYSGELRKEKTAKSKLWKKLIGGSKSSSVTTKRMSNGKVNSFEVSNTSGLISREELFEGLKKDGIHMKAKRWSHGDDQGPMVGISINPLPKIEEKLEVEPLTQTDLSVVSHESQCLTGQSPTKDFKIEEAHSGRLSKKLTKDLTKSSKSLGMDRESECRLLTIVPRDKTIRLEDLDRLRSGVTGDRLIDEEAPVSIQASIGSIMPSTGHVQEIDLSCLGTDTPPQREKISNSSLVGIRAVQNTKSKRFASPKKATKALMKSIGRVFHMLRLRKRKKESDVSPKAENDILSGTQNTQISRHSSPGRKMVRKFSKSRGQQQYEHSDPALDDKNLTHSTKNLHASNLEAINPDEGILSQDKQALTKKEALLKKEATNHQMAPLSISSAPGRISQNTEQTRYPKRSSPVVVETVESESSALSTAENVKGRVQYPTSDPTRSSPPVPRERTSSPPNKQKRHGSNASSATPAVTTSRIAESARSSSLASVESCGSDTTETEERKEGEALPSRKQFMDQPSSCIDEFPSRSLADSSSNDSSATPSSEEEGSGENEENKKEVRFSDRLSSVREIPFSRRRSPHQIDEREALQRAAKAKSKTLKPRRKQNPFSSFIRRNISGKSAMEQRSQVVRDRKVKRQVPERGTQISDSRRLSSQITLEHAQKRPTGLAASRGPQLLQLPQEKPQEEVEEGIELIARTTRHGKSAVLIAKPGAKPKINIDQQMQSEKTQRHSTSRKPPKTNSDIVKLDSRRRLSSLRLFGKPRMTTMSGKLKREGKKSRGTHRSGIRQQRNPSPLTTVTQESGSSLSTDEERLRLHKPETISRSPLARRSDILSNQNRLIETRIPSAETDESNAPIQSTDSSTLGSTAQVDTATDAKTNATASIFTMTGAEDLFSWLLPNVFAPIPVPKKQAKSTPVDNSDTATNGSIVIDDDQWQAILGATEILARQFKEAQKMDDDGSISITEETIAEVNGAISVFKNQATLLGVNERDLMLAVRDDDRSLQSSKGDGSRKSGTTDKFMEMFEYYFAPAGPGSSYGAAVSATSTSTQFD